MKSTMWVAAFFFQVTFASVLLGVSLMVPDVPAKIGVLFFINFAVSLGALWRYMHDWSKGDN